MNPQNNEKLTGKPGKAARRSSAIAGKTATLAYEQTLSLELYVSAGAPNSLRAIANLETLCRNHSIGIDGVGIVDVFREPERAIKATVLLTPTLVKVAPGEPVMILGDLSDTRSVEIALGLARKLE